MCTHDFECWMTLPSVHPYNTITLKRVPACYDWGAAAVSTESTDLPQPHYHACSRRAKVDETHGPDLLLATCTFTCAKQMHTVGHLYRPLYIFVARINLLT